MIIKVALGGQLTQFRIIIVNNVYMRSDEHFSFPVKHTMEFKVSTKYSFGKKKTILKHNQVNFSHKTLSHFSS